MVLGVLPDPGVTVVYVGGGDVLVHHLRHHHKPFGQEVSLSKEGSTCINISHLKSGMQQCYSSINKKLQAFL